MKNIYKIKLFLITLVIFSSCAVDDDVPVQNLTSTIEASVSNLVIVPRTTTSYDLVVNLSQTLPASAQIEYTLSNGTTDIIRTNGGGANTITIPVDLDGALYEEVTLKNLTVLYAENYQTTISSTNNSVLLVKEDTFSVTMNWADAAFDLDLYFDFLTDTWDLLGTAASSLGVTNMENIEGFLAADGNFGMYVSQWNAYTVEVPYTLSFVTDGGIASYNLTYTGTAGYSIWFTKTTDADGVVTYTFYEEDPS
ncbi:MAG: hypothetical protein ACPGTO_04340 [Polaribacter sp.]